MAGRKKSGGGPPKPRASDVRLAAAIAAALEPQLAAVREELGAVRTEIGGVRTEIGAVRTELRTGLAHVGTRVDELGNRFDNSFSTSGELVRDLRRRVEELERSR